MWGRSSLSCRRQRSIPIVASIWFRNHSRDRHSFRNFPLNDSSVPFCQGLPGSMNAVSIFAVCSQRRALLHEDSAVGRFGPHFS